MLDLLKAIKESGPEPDKKFFVTIEDKEVEVSLAKKLEVMKHGEGAYMWKGDTFVLKPKPKIKTTYRTLQKDKQGYDFVNGDIHWPDQIVEGGYTWQRESE